MSSEGPEPASRLRTVLLVFEPEPEVEPDEAERSARRLRAELKELDVESVTPVTSQTTPEGAKGLDASILALLITLSTAGGVFAVLIETARDWLARSTVARRISVTIDGDTIVLEKASVQERSDLIDAYIRRHEVG